MIRSNEVVMKRPLLLASVGVVVLSWGQPVFAQDNIAPDTRLRLPQPPGAPLAPENRTFIDHALAGASASIAAGRLAAQKNANGPVHAVGEEIAADQQKLKDDLTQVAASKGYKPEPAAPSPPELRDLLHLTDAQAGGDFNQRYLTAQYQASRWLLGAYQTEMAQTQDLELRTFAAERELMLRKHLDAIQKAAGSVGIALSPPKSAPQY